MEVVRSGNHVEWVETAQHSNSNDPMKHLAVCIAKDILDHAVIQLNVQQRLEQFVCAAGNGLQNLRISTVLLENGAKPTAFVLFLLTEEIMAGPVQTYLRTHATAREQELKTKIMTLWDVRSHLLHDAHSVSLVSAVREVVAATGWRKQYDDHAAIEAAVRILGLHATPIGNHAGFPDSRLCWNKNPCIVSAIGTFAQSSPGSLGVRFGDSQARHPVVLTRGKTTMVLSPIGFFLGWILIASKIPFSVYHRGNKVYLAVKISSGWHLARILDNGSCGMLFGPFHVRRLFYIKEDREREYGIEEYDLRTRSAPFSALSLWYNELDVDQAFKQLAGILTLLPDRAEDVKDMKGTAIEATIPPEPAIRIDEAIPTDTKLTRVFVARRAIAFVPFALTCWRTRHYYSKWKLVSQTIKKQALSSARGWLTKTGNRKWLFDEF
ncbi:hypothetical protein DFJ73DRAFT_959899 [Zopfochytrium polystomum]|nr:hypothetical protein DFJ73DRAFT_959899 [Zopfochytrium polystomum]